MLRVIDIESTGIDPAKDKIIEIASVDLTKTGIENEMRTFVNPQMPIPPQSSAVHHLLDEDVAGQPLVDDAIGMFRGADYYVAHNAAFEKSFLSPWLGDKWICTYKCALRLWPDAHSHSNQALRYQLGLSSPFGRDRRSIVAHSALDDCVVTAAIFLEITKRAKWADILQWSSEPGLMTIAPFGKHKGQRFDAVPKDYLEWILRSDMDESAKFSAKYWLSKRG